MSRADEALAALPHDESECAQCRAHVRRVRFCQYDLTRAARRAARSQRPKHIEELKEMKERLRSALECIALHTNEGGTA